MRSQTTFAFFVAVLCLSAVCIGHVAHGQDSAAKFETQKPGDGEATIANKSLAERVYEIDFRNSNFDQKLLAPLGHGSLYGLQLIRPEEKGLRITIPSSCAAVPGTCSRRAGCFPTGPCSETSSWSRSFSDGKRRAAMPAAPSSWIWWDCRPRPSAHATRAGSPAV